MSIDSVINVYFVGAVITGMGTSNLKHFFRCTLLWPFFWIYVFGLFVVMAFEDFRE